MAELKIGFGKPTGQQMGTEDNVRGNAPRRPVAVPSLRKATLILDLIGRRGSLPFSAIQKSLDLPKSTTHQLLKALIEVGALSGRQDGSFALGPKLWELGALSARQRTIERISLRYLDLLARETRLSCMLGTREGCHVVSLAHAGPDDNAVALGNDGVRFPLHRTALGKALLAYLDEPERLRLIDDFDWTRTTPTSIVSPLAMHRELELVRERGWALDDGEHDRVTRCIAAPVFDNRRRVVAAIAMVGNPERITPEIYGALSELVRSTAEAVTVEYIAS